MFDRVRHALSHVLAAVLLAAISLHAAVPAKAMEQSRGSAFSATTVDVAVLVKPRQAEKAIPAQPEPTGPPYDCIAPLALCSTASSPALFRLPNLSRGPPLRSIRAQPAQPRAPPTN